MDEEKAPEQKGKPVLPPLRVGIDITTIKKDPTPEAIGDADGENPDKPVTVRRYVPLNLNRHSD